MDKRSVVVSVFVAVFVFAATVSAQGLATPVPAGYRTIAAFTGAFADFGNSIATNVHCSSFDTAPLDVLVQFFQRDGNPAVSGEGQLTILPGHTVVISTRSNLYPITLPVAVGMDGGPVRVLANGKRLACTAYVLSGSTSHEALFVIPLPALIDK